jgi:hypothetical protein
MLNKCLLHGSSRLSVPLGGALLRNGVENEK